MAPGFGPLLSQGNGSASQEKDGHQKNGARVSLLSHGEWSFADMEFPNSKCSDYRRAQADEQEVTRRCTATFARSETKGPFSQMPLLYWWFKASNALAFGGCPAQPASSGRDALRTWHVHRLRRRRRWSRPRAGNGGEIKKLCHVGHGGIAVREI